MKKNRGVIAIPFLLSTFGILTLFGMLTESTLIIHSRNQLFDGAENAVLAAANLHKTGNYSQDSLLLAIRSSYCASNNLVAASTTLDFSQIASDIIIIDSTKSVPTLFFQNTVTVRCRLGSTIPQPASSLTGLAPIAMLESDFLLGNTYTVKQGGGGGDIGNFGCLALSGNGATDYENDFKYGYSGTISIGGTCEVKTGNMKGSTVDAVEYRMANGTEDILVVLTDEFPTGSSSSINVVGFAAFHITGVNSQGEVTGTFITYKAASGTGSSGTSDHGVYIKPKLVFL